ncbi:MAG: hypothetical protein V8Q85_06070 [Christensenellales bacterium]
MPAAAVPAIPEPIADFMDAIMIGDGEDMIMEVCDAVFRARGAAAAGGTR